MDASREATTRCTVCLDDISTSDASSSIVHLPCCGGDPDPDPDRDALRTVCRACMESLMPSPPRLGRCPFCRAYLEWSHTPHTTVSSVVNGTAAAAVVEGSSAARRLVVAGPLAGTCPVCSQAKLLTHRAQRHLPPHGGVVDMPVCYLCYVGTHVVLRYECDRARHIQLIPHPMFTYQPTPARFSEDTWVCGGCQDQTKWRALPADVARLGPDLIPPRWHEGAVPRAEDWVLVAQGLARSGRSWDSTPYADQQSRDHERHRAKKSLWKEAMLLAGLVAAVAVVSHFDARK
jgi:hypothetical protein